MGTPRDREQRELVTPRDGLAQTAGGFYTRRGGPRATVFSRFWAPTMADDPPFPLPTAVFTKQSARTAEAGGQPGRPSNKVNCLVDRRGAPRCLFNLSIADGLKRYAFSVIAALLIRLEPRVNRKKDASPRI